MGVTIDPERAEILETETLLIRCRLTTSEGTLYTVDGTGGSAQPKIATLTAVVFDLSSATPTTAVVTKTWSDGGANDLNEILLKFSESLQTSGWSKDTTGWNCIIPISNTDVTWAGGHFYRVEIGTTTTSTTTKLPSAAAGVGEGRLAFQVLVDVLPGYST